MGDAGILDRVRPTYKTIYPFTIYHASSKATRRYTLYAPSDSMRKKWKYALADAITVRKVHQESNMVRIFGVSGRYASSHVHICLSGSPRMMFGLDFTGT